VRESRREVKAGTEKIRTEEMDGHYYLVAGWPPNIGRGRIGATVKQCDVSETRNKSFDPVPRRKIMKDGSCGNRSRRSRSSWRASRMRNSL
jgi:hypothetical protein